MSRLLRPLGVACAAISLHRGSGHLSSGLEQFEAVVRLTPCDVPSLESFATRCATISVPENRALPHGRMLGLRVVVVAPDSGAELPDPIVPVPGGPGGGTIDAGGGWARVLTAARGHRALILVDPRGTGQSGALDCDFSDGPAHPASYVNDFTPPAKVQACAARLSRSADLTQYTTEAIATDLADVLTALGYEKVNLYGVSGGTRQAVVFASKYPGRVRTLTLGGVVPPDFRLPLDYAHDSQRALNLLFFDCEKDIACHSAFPKIRDDMSAVLRRLDRAPARVPLRFPGRGIDTALVTLGRFTDQIRAQLYSQDDAADVPYVVHRAAANDFVPFVETLLPELRVPPSPDRVATGHYLSVTCAEDVDRIRSDEREAAASGTFLGDYRVQQQVEACKLWPHATLPAAHFQIRPLPIPTLMISGDADPVTPPRWAEVEKRYLPNARLVVFPTGGHVPFGTPCAARLASEFIVAGDAQRLDVSCAATLTRPPFRTR